MRATLLALSLALVSTAASASDVLIAPSEKPILGQVIPGAELKMILTTLPYCYIPGMGDEFPYYGMIPRGKGTDGVCWRDNQNQTMTVLSGSGERTVYPRTHFYLAEGIGDWSFRVKQDDLSPLKTPYGY
jgi:hypothetical protein